ncbi:transporter [Apiospora kogelbergensis]|uniref:Transporter n=1 Tax=Apiospora kogelbergensis TaxID=1337665 RepID=A0AAW0RBA3_9PEZI
MALSKFLQRPPGYVVSSTLCALSGFSFGIETSIIGPILVMDDFRRTVGGSDHPTIQGLIVSSLILAAAFSSLVAGRLADGVGRVRGIAIGTLIFAVGAALQAGSVNLAMFIVGRIVEGVGEGLYVGPMIVYITEISTPKYRAALTTAPQLFHTLGLVVGFFTCYGTESMASSFSWRLPLIILAVYSFVFTAMALVVLPESPRWLTLRGRGNETAAVWDRLGVELADREKAVGQLSETTSSDGDDEKNEKTQSKNEDEHARRTPGDTEPTRDEPKQVTIWEAFSDPNTRPQLLAGLFLMGMIQMSGIDGVLFYAPLVFQQAGLTSNQASFLASGVSGIVIFAVTIPATIWADSWGRRPSLILGGVSMAVLMFLIGGLYAGHTVHADAGAGRWVVIVAIYVYIVIFCISWAIHVKVFAAEIQPKRTRATATGMAYVSYSLTNFLVALIVPIMLAATDSGAYFLFGGCLLLTAVVCFLYMPETRGRSLDEIEGSFHSKGLFRGVRKSTNAA